MKPFIETPQIEDIQALVTDPDFLELKRSLSSSNLFSTLAASHLELWHSAFIKWILDANSEPETGLGDFALKRFLTLVLQNSLANPTKQIFGISFGDLEAMDLSSVDFEVEKSVRLYQEARRIDIYGESQTITSKIENVPKKIRIIVENKVKSLENNDQTVAYAKWADLGEDGSVVFDYDFFVFLTPFKNEAPKSNQFVPVTYQELVEQVLIPSSHHPNLNPEAKYLLQQYLLNLGTPLKNGKPMAATRKEICLKIFKAHEDVLNEIFNCAKKERLEPERENKQRQSYRISLEDLIQQGILSKTDTLHADFDGKHFAANLILNDDSTVGIVYSGNQYESPSRAAMVIKGGAVNGWEFWEVKDANGQPKGFLAELRKKALPSN